MKITLMVMLLFVMIPLVNAGDALDNWCDAGGPWGDGRCNAETEALTKWFYTCGWYMARYERGEFSRGQVDSSCLNLLPPIPIVNIADLTPEQIAAICKLHTLPDGVTLSYVCGFSTQTGTIDTFNDGVINLNVLFTNLSDPCPPSPKFFDSSPNSGNYFWSDPVYTPLNLLPQNCTYTP